MNRLALAATCFTTLMLTAAPALANDDPYLWLEEVQGEKALNWVRERNAKTQAALEAMPEFKTAFARFQEIANSKERIPAVAKRGEWLYNLWQDEANPRGLWRRTSLAEFRKAEPKWEVVLDLDQLGKDEKENWVWKGAACLRPAYDRCLLSLSRGGADAVVVREFDVAAKAFVKDGFALAEAKGGAGWIDRDTVFVQTNFGPESMTASGYPRITKEWKRGTPLTAAKTVYSGLASDISVGAFQVEDKGYPTQQIVRRGVTFFTAEHFWRKPADSKGERELVPLHLPSDAAVAFVWDLLVLTLRSDWTIGGKTYPQGALISIPFTQFLSGARAFDTLFEPGERKTLAGWANTRNTVLLNELDNLRNRLVQLKRVDGKWVRRDVALPGTGTLSVAALDADESDEYFLTLGGYLAPTTLFLSKAGSDQPERLKGLPSFFDASPFRVEQQEATSKDGTKVPYFVVMNKNAKLDGSNPTLLYGYGGFRVSQLPGYSGYVGEGWLKQGGVFVVANIRGGGEFGPRWHQAGLKANRQRVFDDFIAVAEDLAKRKITSPRHLGISGGSNGGLLVGAVMLQRPELFKAVVCSVPLLDMQRYHKLLAGASWVAEYGNPDDPKEWTFISKYSPYQNVKPNAKLPSVLFITSTRDDRVHPGHARKMMARMEEQGHSVNYYENIEGGHGVSANNRQLAYRQALQYAYLLRELR